MSEIERTTEKLREHVRVLTRDIGERSVRLPDKLEQAAQYIESVYQDIGIPVHREPYTYRNRTVSNIVAEISFRKNPKVQWNRIQSI